MIENGELPPPQSQQLRDPDDWNVKTMYVLFLKDGNDAQYVPADDATEASSLKAGPE